MIEQHCRRIGHGLMAPAGAVVAAGLAATRPDLVKAPLRPSG